MLIKRDEQNEYPMLNVGLAHFTTEPPRHPLVAPSFFLENFQIYMRTIFNYKESKYLNRGTFNSVPW